MVSLQLKRLSSSSSSSKVVKLTENPSPVPRTEGPRPASARLRQGYEVHRKEDERATVEEREDEHTAAQLGDLGGDGASF